MSTYQIGPKGRSDLDNVFSYTEQTWGAAQALKYLEGFAATFQLLSDSPSLGRTCSILAPRLRRFEYEQHVIFYRPLNNGIHIARILHQRMMPSRHALS